MKNKLKEKTKEIKELEEKIKLLFDVAQGEEFGNTHAREHFGLAILSFMHQDRTEIYNQLSEKKEFVTYKKDGGHGVAIPLSEVMDILRAPITNHSQEK